MVKETDKDMQRLYHKTCEFCKVFCGHSWCPVFDEKELDLLDLGYLPEEDV